MLILIFSGDRPYRHSRALRTYEPCAYDQRLAHSRRCPDRRIGPSWYAEQNACGDEFSFRHGYDTFVFDSALNSGVDRITDFSQVGDTIRLENAVFTALNTAGTLSSSAFYAGTAAHDATDRIIYNAATGALSYDTDGSGAAAPIQFALLGTGLHLTASDFIVI